MLGALIIMSVENHDKADSCDQVRNKTLTHLYTIFQNHSAVNWSLATDSVRQLEHCFRGTNSSDKYRFSFVGSIAFCMSVFSTLGYGELTPMTTGGQIFTMIFAFLGIPLYISFTADMGEWLMARILESIRITKKLLHKINPSLACGKSSRRCQAYVILLVMTTAFILCISLIFMVVENSEGQEWSYLDALYFVSMSVTLVGFGDLLATHRYFVYFEFFLIVIGQVMLAMLFYIAQKTIRYKLPRLLSSCCLWLMAQLSENMPPPSEAEKVGEDESQEQFESGMPMCLKAADITDSAEEARPTTNTSPKIPRGRFRHRIEKILPWHHEDHHYLSAVERSATTTSSAINSHLSINNKH